MASKRDVIIFFAGAQCFHTLSHGLMYWINKPIDVGFMIVTPGLNFWSMVFNGLIAVWLLWWASRSSN